MTHLKVLIAGAGLGGLCLAQALRQHDIDVEIFERDTSPWDRPQGYRLHIDLDGVNALYQSLPPELYRLFDATSMRPLPFTTIIDTNLAIQTRMSSDEWGSERERVDPSLRLPSHVNVDRATLRQILSIGLEDIIHFRKKLSSYESDEQGVTVTFEDGTTATGDLLVGADGVRSMVRKQRVPHATIQDTGVRAIYCRIPMTEAVEVLPQQVCEDVFTIAIDFKKRFVGLGPAVFPTHPDIAAAQLMPKAKLRPQYDYIVCIIGGKKDFFGEDDSRLRTLRSEELQTVAVDLMKEWPERSRAIPAHGDPTSFFFVEMDTSIPCEIPRSANVTLVGDAIHAMSPALGRGANMSMRDGALLGRHLKEVIHGRRPLAEAIYEYETNMAQYGFDVVRKSAALGTRLVEQNPLPERY